ncbi:MULTISPECIES: hypothetical protein [unclassified Thioalkalivibrio]|uniref:hypothetical protein n=1 Tax=unclassified Thioalkalivibrio TaxID=2621013 RepID=UPI00036CFCF0|nr:MULTISPECIES: hypothetical protein [unclassified Thioalkalivibrio]
MSEQMTFELDFPDRHAGPGGSAVAPGSDASRAHEPFFLLGAMDAEMRRVAEILDQGVRLGICSGYEQARINGRPVHVANAFKAVDAPSAYNGQAPFFAVECSPPKGVKKAIPVTHEKPGLSEGPSVSDYLSASLIGQVVGALSERAIERQCSNEFEAFLSERGEDLRFAAAADHALSAAYQGQCPGVDPSRLAEWRLRERAAARGIPVDHVRDQMREAVDVIEATSHHGASGESLAGAPLVRLEDSIPEVREAAAYLGVAVEYEIEDMATNNRKLVLVGASPGQVAEWMGQRAPDLGGERIHGSPSKGTAQATLDIPLVPDRPDGDRPAPMRMR